MYVVVACVTAYGSLVAADLADEYAGWTVKAKDSNPDPNPNPNPTPTLTPTPNS